MTEDDVLDECVRLLEKQFPETDQVSDAVAGSSSAHKTTALTAAR